jgi:hypothetical protein
MPGIAEFLADGAPYKLIIAEMPDGAVMIDQRFPGDR